MTSADRRVARLDRAVSRERPYRVLFVCTGNLCRSPSAGAVLVHLAREAGLADFIRVESAGLSGRRPGDDADPRALAALRARGYPLTHTVRHVERDWGERFDLLLAMDSSHIAQVRTLMPGADPRLLREWDPEGPGDVLDPYYDGPEAFEGVLDVIERSCRALLDDLRGVARPAL